MKKRLLQLALAAAGLLHNVSASYGGARNKTTVTTDNVPLPEDYISRSATIDVRQPLFNLDAWARYKQGKAQSAYAAAQFDSKAQDVIVRVTGAYIEALFKEDQVTLARAE